MLPIGRPGYFRIVRTRTKGGRTSGGIERQLCFGDRIPDLHSARLHRVRRRSSRVSRYGVGQILTIGRPGYIYIRIGRTSGGVGVERQVCFGDRIPDPDLHSALLHSARRGSSRVRVGGEGEILTIRRPGYIDIRIGRTGVGGGVDKQVCFGDRIPDPDLHSALLYSARR